MDNDEFMRRQQEAVEKMREMNARAVPNAGGQNMPPVPRFVRLQNNRQNGRPQPQRQRQSPETQKPQNGDTVLEQKEPQAPKAENKGLGILSGLNIPFLDMLAGDADVSLIIGLMLILMSEKADKKLLFALVYILL